LYVWMFYFNEYACMYASVGEYAWMHVYIDEYTSYMCIYTLISIYACIVGWIYLYACKCMDVCRWIRIYVVDTSGYTCIYPNTGECGYCMYEGTTNCVGMHVYFNEHACMLQI
jgi:hypothetical protein